MSLYYRPCYADRVGRRYWLNSTGEDIQTDLSIQTSDMKLVTTQGRRAIRSYTMVGDVHVWIFYMVDRNMNK